MPKDKIRVSLDLTETFNQRLVELEALTHADSKAEVIRDALRVYEFIARKTRQGHKFIVADPKGVQEHVLFFTTFEADAEEETETAYA
jgi:hypothetical protein